MAKRRRVDLLSDRNSKTEGSGLDLDKACVSNVNTEEGPVAKSRQVNLKDLSIRLLSSTLFMNFQLIPKPSS